LAGWYRDRVGDSNRVGCGTSERRESQATKGGSLDERDGSEHPMSDQPQPPHQPPQQHEPVYEPPDDERAASAAPTEAQLNYETPTVAALDQSPPPASHDPYAALRLGVYRLYVASYALAIIGGQVQGVAVAWQIYQKTQSALSLGWVGGIQVIPLFLLALPAGHVADTVSRKKLLITTQWLLAGWGVLLAALAYFGRDWPLLVPAMYAVIFLNAVTLVFARPARQSLLPQLVPPQVFSNAVTWNSSSFEICSMAGPAIGGFLVAFAGAPVAYLTNAVLLVACALLTVKFPPTPVKPRNETPGFRSLLAGVSFVWSRKLMLATMLLDLFAVLLGGAVYLLPVFAKDILHVGATGFGWLRAAPSFGAFTMALILAHRPPMRHAGRALLLAVAGFGVATIVFGLSKNFWLSFAMLICTGACDNISVVIRHTLVQLLTPDAMRGRVSAVNQVFIGSSNELGGLESGVTAAWWGPVRSVLFGGIGTLATVAVVGYFFPPLRKLGKLEDVKSDGP
jgi:MFS family permease